MKIFLSIFLFLGLCFTGVFAESEVHESPYKEVEHYNFDLKTEIDGSKVKITWNTFVSDEKLKWFKFVYSTKTSSPVYPDHTTSYVGNDASQTSYTQGLKEGNYYVRLCAITEDNGRYCSKVHKVAIEKKEYEEEKHNMFCTKEYVPVCGKQGEHKKTYGNKCTLKAAGANYLYSGKCDYTEEKKEETIKKPSSLSSAMKGKINTMLKKFTTKLEAKDYSDEKIVSVVDTIIKKLHSLENQEKYKAIVAYMIEYLNKYKSQYENTLGELEDIFTDF